MRDYKTMMTVRCGEQDAIYDPCPSDLMPRSRLEQSVEKMRRSLFILEFFLLCLPNYFLSFVDS